MRRYQQRPLAWFGDVVKEFKLSDKAAALLFGANKVGRESNLYISTIKALTGTASEDGIRKLVKKMVTHYKVFEVCEFRKFTRTKEMDTYQPGEIIPDIVEEKTETVKGYHIRISKSAWDSMNAVTNGARFISCPHLWQFCSAKLNVTDRVVFDAIVHLNSIGYSVSMGSLETYTGFSMHTILNSLRKPAIAKRLIVKRMQTSLGKELKLYTVKHKQIETLFLGGKNKIDKTYTVCYMLEKEGVDMEKENHIAMFLRNRRENNKMTIVKPTSAMAIYSINHSKYLSNLVKNIFGYDLNTILLDSVILFGKTVYELSDKEYEQQENK